jgi:putative flippase GtrA
LVGSIGFVADATVLHLLVGRGWDAYLGRLASFLCAGTVTWALNRRFTFQMPPGRRLHREWTRYLALNGIGAGINYAVYAACLLTLDVVRAHLVLGVAAGSVAGLGFNFVACNLWLFPHRATGRDLPHSS